MRHDITFLSQGLRCSAYLYLPADLQEGRKAPAIVLAHGFACIKEQGLAPFAERFAGAGFAVLVFDYRWFGQSEGEPRGQLFPLEQIEDYRNAISWISDHPQVDSERIGAWGTSFSGGLVLQLAAFDRRVKAVVAQVPSVLNYKNLWAAYHRTGAVNTLKVVAPEGEPCVLPGRESYEAFLAFSENAPDWQNTITTESLEKIREYDSTRYIHLIAPTSLLIIGAKHDSLIPADMVEEAYKRAGEPKELLMLPCRHFDVYSTEPWFSAAAGAAVEWFVRHLGSPTKE